MPHRLLIAPMTEKVFGLIGYPLTHSFSKRYFTEKFAKEGIRNCRYELFELPDIQELPLVFAQNPSLKGLNVTIPHKLAVLPFLSSLDTAAAQIGAVNVVKIMPDGALKGYNSDYYGFRYSLEQWAAFRANRPKKALLLGEGGATKAVKVALEDLDIAYQSVSRQAHKGDLTYADLDASVIASHTLLINCTPLGTYPHVDACADVPYDLLTPQHLLYDLVYNPAETLFMRQGIMRGAAAHNGLRMLELQAEKSWEIWNNI